MKTYANLNLSEFFLEWEIFQTKYVEKIKPHFMLKNFFRKSCRLWDNGVKYYINSKATDESIMYNSEQNRCNLHVGNKANTQALNACNI
jgi:hypothetical protein